MLIELGNAHPVLPKGETRDAACVTQFNVSDDPENYPEGHHAYQVPAGGLQHGDAVRAHLADKLMGSDGRVTQLPGHEAVIAVVSPFGVWASHAEPGTKPTWVYSDNAAVQQCLSEFYGCPAGRPADVETTHYTTYAGMTFAPGEDSGAAQAAQELANAKPDLQANITQNGRDIQARVAFGGQTGLIGAGTAATATSLTTNLTLTTNAWAGYRVFVYSTTSNNIVWANVISNTNAAGASVLTVDRWYAPATPGGTAGTTPTTPWAFVLSDGGAPSWFMGLSTSTTALGTPSTNATLPSEITTAGGGLVRQICPWAHTASAATTTLTPVYTANGTDSLPVTIGSIGTCNSMVPTSTPNMFFNTLLTTTATLSASGDQLTITQTITGT